MGDEAMAPSLICPGPQTSAARVRCQGRFRGRLRGRVTIAGARTTVEASMFPGPSDFSRTNTSTPQLQFTAKDVQKAALSFRKGSAPGPSGLRPEHLNVVLKGAPANRTDKAGAALTRLVNIMVRGEVPEEVAPFLCGARLHAALKKDGGLRPIAVGNMTRRLASKLVASELASRASSYLSPHQLGVGTKGGCEAIVHSVRQALLGW